MKTVFSRAVFLFLNKFAARTGGFLYRPFSIADDKEQDRIRGLNRVKTMFVKGTVTMKKEDFIALGLADDLAKKCADALILLGAIKKLNSLS